MRARLVSIGDELLDGSSIDSNSTWLAEHLTEHGVTVVGAVTVADDVDRIAEALDSSASNADLVIATGGLGPTPDDVTRQGFAAALGCDIVDDPGALSWIRAYLAARTLGLTDRQASMARRPETARCHRNEAGTAPILQGSLHGAAAWMLPGPPREMRSAWEAYVAPSLRGAVLDVAWRGSVRCHGLIEADAAERLGSLLERSKEVVIGTRITNGLFVATITAPDEETGIAVRDQVESRLQPWALGRGDQTLSSATGHALELAGATVSTAESCTGGGIGAMFVETPGSSAWYCGGVVTYTNESKIRELAVPASYLDAQGPGAVSRDVAIAMARGVRERFSSMWSVSVTGIAGPDGGSGEKPVGTVWMAISGPDDVIARRFHFHGTRRQVQRGTCLAAMQLLRFCVLGVANESSLAWECDR